jgi:class 3 adenylate cyclase/tetratricopeptide (TPR) repeat protein
MKCPKCQAENPEDSKFCIQCAAPMEYRCPNCGATTPATGKFCKECGHELSVASPTPAPPVELSFEEKLENIQRYLPDGLTEKILAQRGKIEGEHKQVTVMFCDTEGFTVLSEKLGPEKVYSIMGDVFEMLIHKVNEFGGTVNKMTGDGVMALFGAPIALEDAPQRAIRSALAIQREIARFSDKTKQETGAPLRMRIGIHTGPVVVGTLGNDLRVEFTAVGDTVNLASRMEGLAEPGTVYVTEETFKLTEGLFRFEALGEREVKGKEAPVKAYHIIAPSTRRTRFDVSAERGLTPFLGRERELELLLDGLERAKSGRGQAFSIMGEAGVGKSRLLYEFRKAIANEDVFFQEGRCLSYSTNVAYHPMIDLLKATFDIRDADRDDQIREKVKTGLKVIGVAGADTHPFLLELLSVKDSGIEALNLSPEARKDKTLEALKKIVLKGSEMRPLVMAVEDLHWVDKSSEEAFKDMLDAISGAQLLLIFTYRPEFVHTWGGKSYHNQVNLNRLSNRETLAMASYILGTEIMGADLEELILSKTEGIPFFVEEFMKSLKDLKMIEWRDSGYYLAKDIKEVEIPSTIQEVIMARVDSLPDGAKSVLQTGSAIGREFSCELIKRVMGIPTPEMTPHLSVLRDSELLYERGVFPQATYIFRHSLTQEVAYDSLLEKKKREIHERIGQAIEELYSDRIEEFYEMLAYHYARSENLEKAYQYLKLSGEKAAQRLSHWEAFRLYKEAINVLTQLPETEENKRKCIEVGLRAAESMSVLGYPEDSLQILEKGESLAKALDDERSLSYFYSSIGLRHLIHGDTPQGTAYAEKAFDVAERILDVDMVATTGNQLCPIYMVGAQYTKGVDVAQRVTALLEKTQMQHYSVAAMFWIYPWLLSLCGHSMGALGDSMEGRVSCEKAVSFARELNNLSAIATVEFNFGWFFVHTGNGEKAVEHFKIALPLFEEHQVATLLGNALAGLGWGYYLMEDLEGAREHAQRAMKFQKDAGIAMFLSMPYWLLGSIYLDSDDLTNARGSAEEALQLAQSNGEKWMEAISSILLGRILGRVDKTLVGEAEEYVNRGIDILKEHRVNTWLSVSHFNLGELYADIGQREKALENLKKAETAFQEMGMDYYLRRTQEVLERVEG